MIDSGRGHCGPAMAFPESILSSFNDLRRHSRVLFLPLTAKAPAAAPMRSASRTCLLNFWKTVSRTGGFVKTLPILSPIAPPFDWALSPPVGTPRDRAEHCLGLCAVGFGAIAKIIHSTQMRKAAAL
jgi:hypothetical protein